MLGNQLLNFISGFEEDLNRLKRVDPVYTTGEAGKRRSVNHTRARSPRRAENVLLLNAIIQRLLQVNNDTE